MVISRRGFLAGIIAAGVAPAFVKSKSLMPLWVPDKTIIHPYALIPNNSWRLELVQVLPMERISDLKVQPMFRHITSIPMLVALNVELAADPNCLKKRSNCFREKDFND